MLYIKLIFYLKMLTMIKILILENIFTVESLFFLGIDIHGFRGFSLPRKVRPLEMFQEVMNCLAF